MFDISVVIAKFLAKAFVGSTLDVPNIPCHFLRIHHNDYNCDVFHYSAGAVRHYCLLCRLLPDCSMAPSSVAQRISLSMDVSQFLLKASSQNVPPLHTA